MSPPDGSTDTKRLDWLDAHPEVSARLGVGVGPGAWCAQVAVFGVSGGATLFGSLRSIVDELIEREGHPESIEIHRGNDAYAMTMETVIGKPMHVRDLPPESPESPSDNATWARLIRVPEFAHYIERACQLAVFRFIQVHALDGDVYRSTDGAPYYLGRDGGAPEDAATAFRAMIRRAYLTGARDFSTVEEWEKPIGHAFVADGTYAIKERRLLTLPDAP